MQMWDTLSKHIDLWLRYDALRMLISTIVCFQLFPGIFCYSTQTMLLTLVFRLWIADEEHAEEEQVEIFEAVPADDEDGNFVTALPALW